MITQKKEESKKTKVAEVIPTNDKNLNVLNIKVEDNFDIDDI